VKLFDETAIVVATIWAEARSEPLEGIMAVGEVIRRRTKLRYNSDGTLTGTCGRVAQFSCWSDEQRILMFNLDWDDPVVTNCLQAWVQSEWTDYSNGAVLYYSPKAMRPKDTVPWWSANCRKVAELGGHIFFVELN
jgi:spore germination cell wall hydrolase CwlJ-like protein